MQSNFIKAFRERLRRAGYVNVYIRASSGDRWLVAVEKDGVEERYLMTEQEILNCPRTVWFLDVPKIPRMR